MFANTEKRCYTIFTKFIEVRNIKKLLNPQQEIYQYLLQYLSTYGYPPSVREICQAVGLTSPATVHRHLQNMEKQGLICQDHSKKRSIFLPEVGSIAEVKPENGNRIPLVGSVAAGLPILADDNIEAIIRVPELLTHGPASSGTFILRVAGDSMIQAGINDGDYIIVDRELECLNGDIIVARTSEETATIKRLFCEEGCIRLQPENDLYSPIILPTSEVEIVGKVIGLMRKL